MVIENFAEPKAKDNGSDSEWEGPEPVNQQPAEEAPGIFATVGLMGFGGQPLSLI